MLAEGWSPGADIRVFIQTIASERMQQMRLDEVLTTARCAEAMLEGGTILVERDIYGDEMQSYCYDVRQGVRRLHNVPPGLHGELSDLADELRDFGIEVGQLDWRGTTRTIDLSDCPCKDCRSFCLAYGLMPGSLPFWEKLWYRARFLVRSICSWLWLSWLWVRPRCRSLLMGAGELARALWIACRYRLSLADLRWLMRLQRQADTSEDWSPVSLQDAEESEDEA
jgi:hypothetical protein